MTIQINSISTKNVTVPYGQTVSFVLTDVSQATQLVWEILPPVYSDGTQVDAATNWPGWTFSNGVLARTQTSSYPAITGKPDVFHSYTVRCKESRAGLPDPIVHSAIMRVLNPRTGTARPAAGENVEADPLRGWWNIELANHEALLAAQKGYIRVYNGTGSTLAALKICKLSDAVDVRTVNGNTNPGGSATKLDKIFNVALANPAEKNAQKLKYCVLPAAIANGAFGWAVTSGGELEGNFSGLIANRQIFSNLTADLSVVPVGKTCIEIGTCVSATSTGRIAVNITVHKDGVETEPSWFGADEDGLTDDIAAINSACVYATTYRKNKTVRVAGSLQVNTASQTIAAGCTLRFMRGGTLTGTGLSTLTILCRLADEGGSNVTPEMFGAVYNGHLIGASDDWLPVQTAINVAASTGQGLRLRAENAGAYMVTQPLLIAANTCPTIKGRTQQTGFLSARTRIAANFTPERQGVAAAVGAPDGSGNSTVTGLTGMQASDVGSWLYFRNIGTAYKGKRFMQIAEYVSATSVKVKNPTATTGTGQEWYFDRRPVLDVRSSESLIQGIAIENYAFTYNFFFAGVRTAAEPGYIMTNCRLRDIVVTSNSVGYLAFGFGFHHADNINVPGNASGIGFPTGWPTNGENNHYEQCHVAGFERAGFYCPNNGYQPIKHIIERCSSSNGPYGIEWVSGGFVCNYHDFQYNSEACIRVLSGNLVQTRVHEGLSESCARFLDTVNASPDSMIINVDGGRHDCAASLASDGYFINALGNLTLNITGVTFQAQNQYNASWKIKASGPVTGGVPRGANLNLDGCHFPNTDPVERGVNNHRLSITGCKGFPGVGLTIVPIRNEYSWPNGDTAQYGGSHTRIGFAGREAITVNTATYAIQHNDQILRITRTSTGACELTLPINPYDGEEHVIKDAARRASVNMITLLGNGKTIEGDTSASIATDGGVATIRYHAASNNWDQL